MCFENAQFFEWHVIAKLLFKTIVPTKGKEVSKRLSPLLEGSSRKRRVGA